MIDANLRHQIADAADDREVTAIVSWKGDPPIKDILARPTQERQARLVEFYRDRMDPVVAWLKQSSRRARVEFMENVGTAVVAAPAGDWRAVLRRLDASDPPIPLECLSFTANGRVVAHAMA